MNILVINAGSSSLKYQLIRMEDETILCKGVCERIGIDGKYSYKTADGYKVEKTADLFTHKDAFDVILHEMVEGEGRVIHSVEEIAAVGHRVTHGGDKFSHSVLIDEATIEAINAMRSISPLHNPPQAATIRACRSVFGEKLPMVAVFDTAFHATMPPKAYTFAIPYKYYEQYGVRRYGFHGTSHRYVSRRACEFLGIDYEKTKIITVHVGGGGSITAIKDGKSIDTSMGLTPVEGLVMGTRSGDVDLGAITYLMDKLGLSVADLNTIINKKSGVLGVSGVSSDMRDIEDAIAKGNERAKLALDMFEYRLLKYIGAYTAALNGVDLIVFTGGIGENQVITREYICKGLNYLGVKFNKELNAKTRGEEVEISTPDSKVRVVVIPTDEELTIATDTMNLVTK